MPENQFTAIVFDPDQSGRELNSPLVRVYNMTVFERTIRALRSAGIEDITILATANFEAYNQVIEEKSLGAPGLKLLREDTAATALNSVTNALLLSQPLLVTPRYIKETIEAGSEKVSSDPNQYMLYLNEQNQKLAGNDISSDLNAVARRLKDKGSQLVITESIGRYVCEPVTDKKSLRSARGRLIRSLRQPSDEFISRTFNRPISLAITRVIGYTPITANQYTIFTGIMGLVTAYILALGGDRNFLIGGIMFHFLAVLDAGDGEIARLKFLASERGQWIDTIVDNITYVATLLGLIIGVYSSDPGDFIIYTGYAAVAFAVLALLSLYIYLLKYNRGGSLVNIDYSYKSDEGFYGQFMEVVQELGRRPFFSVVFMFLGIFGVMEYSLVYVCLMTFFVFAFSLQAHFQAANKPQ